MPSKNLVRSTTNWLALAVPAVVLALSGCRPPVPSPAVDPTIETSSTITPSTTTAADPSSVGQAAACNAESVRDNTAFGTDKLQEAAAPARVLPTRRVRNRDELVRITFDDLKVNMEEDQLFEPAMATDRVRELDGQRVRIRGFLFPAIFQQTGIDKFPLVLNTECKFGPGGLAHHVILVEMIDGATTSYTIRPIAVTGRLTLRPWNGPDGNTWSLYHIAGERVD